MLTENEIKAMIELLDDPDENITTTIENELLKAGEEIIPFLENIWSEKINAFSFQKAQELIKKILNKKIKDDLFAWQESETKDLLEGVTIISRIDNLDTDIQYIHDQINKIKLDAWLEMNYDLTALEKVRVLNHIFFEVNGFSGDQETYISSENSFIHSVIKRRKGNPISLAIIYSVIAQKLNIPIFGINLPQHFILAYMNSDEDYTISHYDEKPVLNPLKYQESLFYINPFNQGLVFSKNSIDLFLKQLNIEPQEQYYLPCSNTEILKRVLNNLLNSYTKENRSDKIDQINDILTVLE